MIPRIAITVGDFNGIGPEVALKAAGRASVRRECRIVLVGPTDIFRYCRKKFRIPVSIEETAELPKKIGRAIPVLPVDGATAGDIDFGRPSPLAGLSAGRAIEYAAKLCLDNSVDAMVTAPVSKATLNAAGFAFPGQTEMLMQLSGAGKAVMMLISRTLRVGLVTIHIPLRDVPSAVTIEKVFETAAIVEMTLRRDFGIRKPSIAVLALNPHASEGGLIGSDDLSVVRPAVELLKKQNMNVSGPYPADGFFAHWTRNKYDAVVAMYHDQGLIPLKMTAAGLGVNFTAGLRIIRTSPDHGTAFDIAGKNAARSESMAEAIVVAARIARRRNLSASKQRTTA